MKPKHLLLVEDNEKDEALTIRAFKRSGVVNDVVVARDGAEALDYLFCTGEHSNRNATDLPTVVLLDLNLPKLSGLDVLARIRQDERTKLLPVVILTSSNEEQDRVKGYRSGANSYVRKPVDFQQFTDAARHLGLYWFLLNTPAVD